MRFTKTHRSVTTFDAIANGLTSEPPKYAVTENDETDGALGATDSDSDNGSDIFLQDVEPNAFHSMDEDGDRVVAVLYISPKKFIYFLKHPEDPDFRAFRFKIPSSATAQTTSL